MLDITNNLVQRLPPALSTLQALHTFRAARNRLSHLRDLEVLRPLANLSTVALAGNPFTARPHWRPYAVYQLPSVDILDGEAIDLAAREEAAQRFSQEELDLLQARRVGTGVGGLKNRGVGGAKRHPRSPHCGGVRPSRRPDKPHSPP